MKSKMLIILISVLLVSIGLYCVYYYVPRVVSFEFVKEIPKPYQEFDNSQFIGFDYVKNEERLMFWLFEKYKDEWKPYGQAQMQGYDSSFVENLSEELNFDKYDYLITYHKKLNKLTYSPYLTKTKDDLYFDKKTPLIPTFDSVITDKLYIYQIKKNTKYRAPGP
jgi:hypothetical protein